MQGQGAAEVGMESAAIRKGDAVPIMINEQHAFVNSGTTDLEFMIVGIAMDKKKGPIDSPVAAAPPVVQ
jgi:mannose-6-phosphate isomerase-like protein (cupin superfamily)